MHRNDRQQKILEIIAAKEIDTQEELCDELQALNFNVTQATVSRDIKELKLYKVSGNKKKHRYACLETENRQKSKMQLMFRECVQSITNVNNLVVIRTMRANAPTSCLFIDSLQLDEILGTLAGEDTILIVADSEMNAQVIKDRLSQYI